MPGIETTTPPRRLQLDIRHKAVAYSVMHQVKCCIGKLPHGMPLNNHEPEQLLLYCTSVNTVLLSAMHIATCAMMHILPVRMSFEERVCDASAPRPAWLRATAASQG